MKYLSFRQLQELIPLSRTTIWRLERKDPTFPQRTRVGPKRVMWRQDEVLAWLEAQPRGMAGR